MAIWPLIRHLQPEKYTSVENKIGLVICSTLWRFSIFLILQNDGWLFVLIWFVCLFVCFVSS